MQNRPPPSPLTHPLSGGQADLSDALRDARASIPGFGEIPLSPGILARWLLIMNALLMVVAALHGQIQAGRLGLHTDGMYVSCTSALEFLAAAACAFRVFTARRAGARFRDCLRAPYLVWALIGIGFVYLPIDQVCSLHQKMDEGIHHILALRETPLSDRIDDAILALYMLTGLTVVIAYRRELMRFDIRRPMFIGFACALVSVVFDAVSDRPDVAIWIIGRPGDAAFLLNGIFEVVEAFTQIAAVSWFLVAMYTASLLARGNSAPPILRASPGPAGIS
jgi:hypothetical protein